MDGNIRMSVSKIVNISAAKRIAFPLVVVLLVVQGVRLLYSGDTCSRLLNGGTLLDSKVWQPDGCMLHKYSLSEGQRCVQQKKIAFVGDSRIRELFYVFLPAIASSELPTVEKAHSPIHFKDENTKVDFLWYSEIDSSTIELYKNWSEDPSFQPDVIFQSGATHTIKRTSGSPAGLNEYKANITKLLPYMEKVVSQSVSNIYWILQEPVVEEKLKESRKAITNSLVSEYNDAALSIFENNHGYSSYPNISILKATAKVAEQFMSLSSDGLHLSPETKMIDVQIILNLICNQVIQPTDGSCCQKPVSPSALQVIVFAIGCLSIAAWIVVHFLWKAHKPTSSEEDAEGNEKEKTTTSDSRLVFKEISTTLARMSLILLYFYLCDRTDIFMKSNKHYTHTRFFIPLLYVVFLGMFGIDQSKNTSLLNRNQTDEWKGWMQLIILIYHVTGASSVIPIYMHIRLLVSMYLFMTGYGHFSFFWNKGDFGFYRVFGVMFRLNFLTVLLCFTMNRPYQFYYFVPMCSFWFLILYLAMAIWPRAYIAPSKPSLKPDGVTELEEVLQNGLSRRSPIVVMSLKLVVLTVVIILLFLSQETFEALFSWWPAVRLFELSPNSVREWWFRCQLDRFAMLHGALFCFAYLILKRLSFLDDSKQGCLLSMKASLITVTASIGTILAYSYWTLQCTSKPECNRVHSYASLLPISSFILVRNIPGYLRSGYSSFFAWFGKISLELFIGQYHIWLAADTKGILVLTSPSWPMLNLVITTFVFVCVAHEINELTGIFAKYVVGSAKDGVKALFIRISLVCLTVVFLMNINSTSN